MPARSGVGQQNIVRSYFRPTNDVKRAMIRSPLRSVFLCALLIAAIAPAVTQTPAVAQGALAEAQAAPAAAQGAPDGSMQISWEVRNRFRLFREERDFLLHTDSAQAGDILTSERALEAQSD